MDSHQNENRQSITLSLHTRLVCGPVLCFLAFALFLCGCGGVTPPESTPRTARPAQARPATATAGIASGSVFEQVRFKEVHTEFQQTYLNLIQNINAFNTPSVDIKTHRSMFSEYGRAQRRYQDVLKKISSYAEDQKLRCFSIMKSMILAILYYDKKTGKKMFKFDPDKLKSEKILVDTPRCPDGGEYSIVYKDGRRLFRCSLHGILRQN
ncbi:MAG TPA: hypothetical protein PLP29_17035 [Candidatus Ozemobacteraceae bacterium]|nr:hypothetical protein [Candidatus Ozemobacteraceae bacterium]